MLEKIMVPDVGEAEDVEVVEVLVAVGEVIEVDTSIVVLESDKASMEIPATFAGTVTLVAINAGDKVEEGSLLIEMETETSQKTAGAKPKQAKPAKKAKAEQTAKPADKAAHPRDQKIETSRIIPVPDVGDAEEVVVVEVLVQRGDLVADGDSLVVLESDKASMEIPTDITGVVQEIFVNEGDEVTEGDPLVTIVGELVAAEVAKKTEVPAPSDTKSAARLSLEERFPLMVESEVIADSTSSVHAGPAVRKQAREYGVELTEVKGSGNKGRILKEDIQGYVKSRFQGGGASTVTSGIPLIPEVDFSKWGEVEEQPLSRIRKVSARNLHRSWLNVPHVTQFDEADITDLEEFRKSQNLERKDTGLKITPLAFLVRAVVDTLMMYPRFNASLAPDYSHLIVKKYYNIGIAVETDDGLLVPVIKNADQMRVAELAAESSALAVQAREKKLPIDAMQGATFTISSLGGIGGTAFTPIVNAPEVAILGVSRSKVTPIYDGETFVPRTMLPLSLSYDHRAIDGAEAARFTNHLARILSDIRRMIV